MNNFNIKITSNKENLTSLEFDSTNITSIIGTAEIQVETKCYTNSKGEHIIDVLKVRDNKKTLIASYTYIYGKDI